MYDNSEEFMTEITALVAKYGDYEAPILKSDGDLLIPLRADSNAAPQQQMHWPKPWQI